MLRANPGFRIRAHRHRRRRDRTWPGWPRQPGARLPGAQPEPAATGARRAVRRPSRAGPLRHGPRRLLAGAFIRRRAHGRELARRRTGMRRQCPAQWPGPAAVLRRPARRPAPTGCCSCWESPPTSRTLAGREHPVSVTLIDEASSQFFHSPGDRCFTRVLELSALPGEAAQLPRRWRAVLRRRHRRRHRRLSPDHRRHDVLRAPDARQRVSLSVAGRRCGLAALALLLACCPGRSRGTGRLSRGLSTGQRDDRNPPGLPYPGPRFICAAWRIPTSSIGRPSRLLGRARARRMAARSRALWHAIWLLRVSLS